MCAMRRSLSAETHTVTACSAEPVNLNSHEAQSSIWPTASKRPKASFTVVFAFTAPESYSTVPHCFTVPYACSLAGKVSRYMFEPGELIMARSDRLIPRASRH